MFRFRVLGLVTILATLLGVSGVAMAHAVVYPRTTTPDSYEKFILRVPVEKESDTTQVKVEIPEGFSVSRVKPMPGWEYTVEKNAEGNTIRSIIWSGGTIKPGEFQEFEFQGKTAKEPGKYAFRAWQSYANGEVVEWTGPSDAQTPASFVELKAGGSATDSHGHEKPAEPTAAPPASAAAASSPPLTAAAAYGGLLLGGVALVISRRRR